jgi:hypothetical protein
MGVGLDYICVYFFNIPCSRCAYYLRLIVYCSALLGYIVDWVFVDCVLIVCVVCGIFCCKSVVWCIWVIFVSSFSVIRGDLVGAVGFFRSLRILRTSSSSI